MRKVVVAVGLRGVLLAAIGLALVLPIPAEAVTLVRPDGSIAQPEQTWANKALMPIPFERITVDGNPCTADFTVRAVACVDPLFPTTIWVADREYFGRWEFLHEIGHLVDFSMQERVRIAFRTIQGAPGREWYDPFDPVNAANDTLSERWADAWAWCARRAGRVPVYAPGHPGYRGTRKHRRVCALIWRATAGLQRPR